MVFHLNACGIICATLTYGFLLYADYVVTLWLILPTFIETIWGVFHIFAYNSLLFLAIFSHLRAMLTDPGIVPVTIEDNKFKQNKPRINNDEDSFTDSEDDNLTQKLQYVGEDWTICNKCQSFRPPRAHHCRVCKRCIRKMDHHCPWVNNCVGEFNQKYFLQFIFYVALLAFYSIVLIIGSWAFHDDNGLTGENGPYGRNSYHLKVVHSICLGIESSLFGLFVVAVSCDQLQAIFNDETVVEAFQRRGFAYRRRRRRSKLFLLRQVCGPYHWSLWALPCKSIPSKRDFIHFAKDLRRSKV